MWATVSAMSGADRTPGDLPASSDDLYETLGVPFDVSAEELNSVFRRLARQHHPDSNPEARSGDFTAVTDAFEVLRDPERRRSYDATRRHRGAAVDAAGGFRIPVHREGTAQGGLLPEQVDLPLTFEQAALGTTVTVEIRAPARCQSCGGSGRTASGTCVPCGGAGSTTRQCGGISIKRVCDACAGRGTAAPAVCPQCAGHGHVVEARDLTVRVPGGTEDGSVLRFTAPGGQEVRAVARVAPHAYFGRRGRDLTLGLPITIAEAALGTVLAVPTLDGAVAIRIPPGTPTGRTFRVRNRGIHDPEAPGDLLVTVDVVIPATLSEEQRAALEAFAAATPSPRPHLEGRPAPRGIPDGEDHPSA